MALAVAQDGAVDLDPDLPAVLGEAADALARATSPAIVRGCARRRWRARRRGHLRRHGPADELVGGPAEDALRGGVPDGDRAVERERLCRERRRVDDRRQQRARPLERPPRRSARRSRLRRVERRPEAGGRAPAQREREGDEGGERRDGDARRGALNRPAPVRRGPPARRRRSRRRRPRSTPAAGAPSRASLDEGDADQGATTATAMPSGSTAPRPAPRR